MENQTLGLKCLEFSSRCSEFLQSMDRGGSKSSSTHAELIDSLEERAKEEYHAFVKIFVNPDGDISSQYTPGENVLSRVTFILPSGTRARVVQNLERKVVERCVHNYLEIMKTEVERLKEKSANAGKTYSHAIGAVTELRIDYIDLISAAEECEQKRTEGTSVLSDVQKGIDKLLEEGRVVEAREAQKAYIRAEQTARDLQNQRDKNATMALNTYHQLTLMFSVYEQAKVFNDFLQRNATILEQTYTHLKIRWDEYNSSGNTQDVLNFLRWNQELRTAREMFELNFAQTLPLIKQVDENVTANASKQPEQNDTETEIFSKAKSLRDKVMRLGPL